MFPVTLKAFPANSKMLMAVVGLIILGFNSYKYKANVSKTFWGLSVWAVILSIVCTTSVIINNSVDFSYATYIITMWVWLAAGYLICVVVKKTHGYINIELISNYIIAVCVLQCVSAIVIDLVPVVKQFVRSYWNIGQLAEAYERLYGFGAEFDPAGIRFSCALVLNANVIIKRNSRNAKTILNWLSFMIILIVGSTISRTTLVGVAFFFIYFIIYAFLNKGVKVQWKKLILQFILYTCIVTSLCVVLYYTNEIFANYIRFAFEMFFNYFEYGVFETTSTNILMKMYEYVPETTKTWIIGDGYLWSPTNIDPYYVGDAPDTEYYMGTDVGYYRLIFYFGIIGLIVFICFLFYAMLEGVRRYPSDKLTFVFIFIINMVCWLKVGTDVFTLYAILLNVDDENVLENAEKE